MSENFEGFSSMRKSADSLTESADSLGGNQKNLDFQRLNYEAKQRVEQAKNHQKAEQIEHDKAEVELESELQFTEISTTTELSRFLEENYPDNPTAHDLAIVYFNEQVQLGFQVSKKQIQKHLVESLSEKNALSAADQVKDYTEFIRINKTPTEIFQLLINKFEGMPAVSTWVENWKNFLKLNQFAENKPPKEKEAIQQIIQKADFTSETAFTETLSAIAQNEEISAQTKLELSQKFSGIKVSSISDLNGTLKEIKTNKQKIEEAIGDKRKESESINSDIEALEEKLKTLPLDSPQRQELETQITEKKAVLKQTETEISELEQNAPKNVSFQIRDGFSALLNPDGSRSLHLNADGFVIKLPSNTLPFTDSKNLRSVNVAFPFAALRDEHIANDIFSPNIENNGIPDIANRQMGHLILDSLGFDDSQILSENSIRQLNTDISRLSSVSGKTGQEGLIELGVYDIASQSIDKKQFAEVLHFVRDNRDVDDKLFVERLKKQTA